MLTVFVNRSQKQRKTHIEKERLFNFISFTINICILKKKSRTTKYAYDNGNSLMFLRALMEIAYLYIFCLE